MAEYFNFAKDGKIFESSQKCIFSDNVKNFNLAKNF